MNDGQQRLNTPVPTGGVMLVGDIGGSNARFALATNGRLRRIRKLPARRYPSLADAIADYLGNTPSPSPSAACIAIAAPANGDDIALTNNPKWCLRRAELKQRFGFQTLTVINDLQALALSLPALNIADLKNIGGNDSIGGIGNNDDGRRDMPRVVVGVGTGLGVSISIGDMTAAGEGGHVAFAPQTEVEEQLYYLLRKKHTRVSAERALCGSGLEILYLAQTQGRRGQALQAATIIRRGIGNDTDCTSTLNAFCGMLGAFAGDAALLAGAVGGVFLGGGMVLRLADFIGSSDFRYRFEDKGRMSVVTAAMPTHIIMHPYAALHGAARGQ